MYKNKNEPTNQRLGPKQNPIYSVPLPSFFLFSSHTRNFSISPSSPSGLTLHRSFSPYARNPLVIRVGSSFPSSSSLYPCYLFGSSGEVHRHDLDLSPIFRTQTVTKGEEPAGPVVTGLNDGSLGLFFRDETLKRRGRWDSYAERLECDVRSRPFHFVVISYKIRLRIATSYSQNRGSKLSFKTSFKLFR